MLTRGWGGGAGGGLGVTATGVTAVGLAWAVLGTAYAGCDVAAGLEPHPAMAQTAASALAARRMGLGMLTSMGCLTSRLPTTLSAGMKKT